MGNIVTFAAVNTKVRALEAKMLSVDQYAKLTECRNYFDLVKYLKEETSYADILSSYSVSDISREQLECMLKRNYVEKFYEINHYFSGEYRKLFSILFMKNEIEDLKVILRQKYTKVNNENIKNSLITYNSPMKSLDFDKLIDSNSIEELVENTEGTVYYKYLIPSLPSIREEGLFRIETTLDFMYFSKLRKCTRRLDKKDKVVIEEINGTYVDLLNIQWVFRGKKYYNLTSEELLNYTVYDRKKLKKETLKKLCYAKDLDDFYELLQSSPYGKLFTKDENKDYLLEREIMVYIKKIFLKYKRENALNISAVIAYLELLLQESRDIIAIAENKKYELSREETLKYITVAI